MALASSAVRADSDAVDTLGRRASRAGRSCSGDITRETEPDPRSLARQADPAERDVESLKAQLAAALRRAEAAESRLSQLGEAQHSVSTGKSEQTKPA
eukprot:scaffold663060_cov60-Prasinocladus_malaysianus.AAC.1